MSNDRPDKPDPLASLAPGYKPPTASPTSPPSAPLRGDAWQAARHGGTETNPWTTALAVIGALAAGIGLIAFIVGIGLQSDPIATPGDGDAAVLVGAGLIGLGGTMLTIWIAVNAIIWQLRRTNST
jgi:hypothetical protein